MLRSNSSLTSFIPLSAPSLCSPPSPSHTRPCLFCLFAFSYSPQGKIARHKGSTPGPAMPTGTVRARHQSHARGSPGRAARGSMVRAARGITAGACQGARPEARRCMRPAAHGRGSPVRAARGSWPGLVECWF